MELNDLKKLYSPLAAKYKLPTFSELNDNFEIDKIEKDTDHILRLIRKVMMEKIVNSLSFLELILNPANAPRMYLSYARSLTNEDRKNIDEIYSSLGSISLTSLDLEIDYSEKKEADMIKEIVASWNSTKPKFRKILDNMKKPNNPLVKKEKSYFA